MQSSLIPETDDGRPYLKMKVIRDATGLPASTIQYYQSLGLLHDTVKTSANMAYYHPDTIERVRLIRLMKSRYRLSMSKIKKLIDSHAADDNLVVVATLNEQIFGPESDNLLDETGYSEATGLKISAIKKLVGMGLLVPVNDTLFDQQDILIGTVLKKAMAYNLNPEDLEFYAEAAKKLADHEMSIRRQVSEHLSIQENSSATLELTQMARAFRSYVFDRTFQKRILTSINVNKPETP